MPSDLEKLKINGVETNDHETFVLEELVYKPAEKRPQFVSNPNASGDVLVRESEYTNSFFEATIRVVPAADTDAALEALSTLTAALQGCERIDDGAEGFWQPNNATNEYAFYTLLGEYVEIPITPEGEMAGWLIETPMVKVRLINRPFLYGELTSLFGATESKAPLQEAYIEVGGDVPAEGQLILVDTAGQARRYAEWGLEKVESEEGNPDLLLEADEDLTSEGYAGVLSTREGSHSGKAIRGTLSETAVTLCSTGPIAHVGSYRAKLRCEAGEDAMLRAVYRQGDGAWTTLPWIELPLADEWCEISLREVLLEEVFSGEQIAEVRIEGKVSAGADNTTAYIDLLTFIPTHRSGVARGPVDLETPSSFVVADSFNQAGEPNATGQEAEVGGVSYEAIANSDATDFTIVGGKLKRTAVADTGTIGGLLSGRGLTVNKQLTSVVVEFTYAKFFSIEARVGMILSYVDDENWIALLVKDLSATESKISVISGATAEDIDDSIAATTLTKGDDPVTIRAIVVGNQLNVLTDLETGNLDKVLTVGDPAIGVEGKAALYDEQGNEAGIQHEFDNLAIWEPTAPLVCQANQTFRVRHTDPIERTGGEGGFWSPVPEYRGAHFFLDPGLNRLVAKMRRNDTGEESDENLTDGQLMSVSGRERFILPR